MSSRIDVYKFGGVAMGSADAVRRALEHVRRAPGSLATVVSAPNGITDLLLGLATNAESGDAASIDRGASALQSRYETLVGELLKGRRATAMGRAITEATNELRAMGNSVAVLRELTPRAQDSIVARGERLMAQIFVAYLQQNRIASTFIDAVDLIATERRLGALWPNFTKCDRAAKKLVLPRLEAGEVVVIPGFIGRGPDGEVVTLGRGGSDFSAAILARSLSADAVTLFKEVDGLMTADPRQVPRARLLAQIHYREAAELAFYGAKVLHPRTIIPLADRKIPLFVRNSFRESVGTRIADDVKPGDYPVRALTAVHDQALVTIEGNGMIGVPGVAGRAFAALARAGHSVSMISQASSEASICFVLPEAEAEHAVTALRDEFAAERKLRLIERVHADKRVALIAVVGLGMRGRPGIAARTFSALSAKGVNVMAIAQGASELNITIAIAESDIGRGLTALHDEFQLDKLHPLADVSGRESKLTLLGFGQIGRELTRQLIGQGESLRQESQVDVKITAIADRSGIKIAENGFSATALQKLAKKKAQGSRLFDRSSPLTLQQLQSLMREELWLLPSHRPILVDLTSEETAPLVQEALERGFHVVLANKKPLAVPQIEFDRMFATARERGLSLRYEATAGAGLPVFDTLVKLREAGDRVEKIVGCFSGTLGFIATALQDGVRFSDAVRDAWKRGYTEPDPRDDLSGKDVARKALILARTLGRRVELSDIALTPLFDASVDSADAATFVSNLRALDEHYQSLTSSARARKEVLRYVARIDRAGITVGLDAVPESSPFGGLRGTANQVAIYSKRYKTNPLVVTGPGAGAAVTAAGVLNDIVAITRMEKRRT